MTERADVIFSLFIAPLPKREIMSVLLDDRFCDKLNIHQNLYISLSSNIAVETQSLHAALQAGLAGKKSAAVKLKNGPDAQAKLSSRAGGKVKLTIGNERLLFNDVDMLSGERQVRIDALSRVFLSQTLRADEQQNWHNVIYERCPNHREFFKMLTELSATPEAFHSEIQKPDDLSVERMMPSDPNYYSRLTANLGKSENFNSFIDTELFEARSSLLRLNRSQAIRRMAFSALWQPLIPFELLGQLTTKEVSILLEAEDPFSLLFGFELCRALLANDSLFVQLGANFLEKLFGNAELSQRRFEVFSACAIITVNKVHQFAKAADKPVFWTRLAALTHARVLANGLGHLPDSQGFLKWSTSNFWPQYFWGGLADRRISPKWRSEWITPRHLFAEVLGRANNTIFMLEEHQRPSSWISSLEAANQKLVADGMSVATSFPGPFDDFKSLEENLNLEELFAIVELKLVAAKRVSEVDGFNALTYATVPTAAIVSNVELIFERRVEAPFENMQLELAELRLGAHFTLVGKSVRTANAVIDRCKFLIFHKYGVNHMTDLLAVMIEACAVHEQPAAYRVALSEIATWLTYAFDDAEKLSELNAVFDLLTSHDHKLLPAFAKPKALLRTKLQKH